MPTLRDRVLFVIAGKNPEFWPRDVAIAAQNGAFDVFEALAELNKIQQPAAMPGPAQTVRRIPRVRQRLWDERPETPTGRFVRATSLDPVLDWGVCDGAVRSLQLITSLAGGVGHALVTLTCSLARQLGRTTRTLQNHMNALTAAGYLNRSTDRRTGRVTLVVTEAVAPPKRVDPPPQPEGRVVWPRLPEPTVPPKVGWRMRMQRLLGGGAKMDTHINKSPGFQPLAALLRPIDRDLDRAVQGAEDFFCGMATDRQDLLR
jgi:hypothetical protein